MIDERTRARNAMLEAGMANPSGDLPCGAVDPSARVPEHQHFDCKQCHAIVRGILAARNPQAPVVEHEQTKLPIMDPEL